MMKTDKLIIAGGLFAIALFMIFSVKDMPITGDKKIVKTIYGDAVEIIDMPVAGNKNFTYKAGLTWSTSLYKGIEDSVKTGKPLFAYFWAPWCTVCKQLEENVYSDPGVNEVLKNDFVLVAINLDEQGEMSTRLGVTAPPEESFFRQDGKEITRIIGYAEPDYFLSTLRNIKSE